MNLYKINAKTDDLLESRSFVVLAPSAIIANNKVLAIKGILGIKDWKKCHTGDYFVCYTFIDYED